MNNLTKKMEYTAPECSTIDLYSEGVLCSSDGFGNFEHDGIDGGNDNPIFGKH